MSARISIRVEVQNFAVNADCNISSGVTAFAGPSGSGKSLTLSAIAGLVRPVNGVIELHHERVFDSERHLHVRSQDRQIGMVFQMPSLLNHRSPLDNVALAVVGESKDARRAQAHHWLERVGANHLVNKSTRELSGGESQRVSLARALAGGCRTLLLDEPFSALDRDSRTALRQLVVDLVADESLTAIVVTHDVDDIVAMAHTVVLFEPGSTVGVHPVDSTSPDSVLRILSRR